MQIFSCDEGRKVKIFKLVEQNETKFLKINGTKLFLNYCKKEKRTKAFGLEKMKPIGKVKVRGTKKTQRNEDNVDEVNWKFVFC